MTDALVYHVASGHSFFSGVVLVQLALALSLRPMGRGMAFGRTIMGWVGLLLMIVSATPLPVWLWVISLGVTLGWLVVEGLSRPGLRRFRPWLRGGVLGLWGLGVALEAPYHLIPTVPGQGTPPLYVIGDSVSAGMGGESEAWPDRFGRIHRATVHNLALAGATVSSAQRQAAGISDPEPEALVLLEIGGNDLLSGTSVRAFEAGLDALLARLRSGGQVGPIVMLELPLPPFFNRYGEVQRRLARRHGVWLVPKRVLLGVLTTPGATVDSIHLSRAGHSQMSETMWRVVRPAYRPASR